MDIVDRHSVRRHLPAPASRGQGKGPAELIASEIRAKKQDPQGSCFRIKRWRAIASVAVVAVMMVVMMVVMMPETRRHHHDAWPIGVMMMVMVVMMGADHDELRQRDVRWPGRRGFIDRFQQSRRIRDRLEQVGEGIRPQDVARGGTRGRCSLNGIHCPERRHRSQKSSDLLIHMFSSSGVSGRDSRIAHPADTLKKNS
jgi:hypothetical protein